MRISNDRLVELESAGIASMAGVYGYATRNVILPHQIIVCPFDSDTFGASPSQLKHTIRVFIRAIINANPTDIALYFNQLGETLIAGGKITNKKVKSRIGVRPSDTVGRLIEKVLAIVRDGHIPVPLTIVKPSRLIAACGKAESRKRDNTAKC